jgi:hypothetical protein
MKAALAAAGFLIALPAAAQEHDHSAMGHDIALPAPAAASPDPHAGHDMSAMTAPADPHAGHVMASGRPDANLGPYSMRREASGTSWQPEASPHEGIHGELSGWRTMLHANLFGVYDQQGGKRGGDRGFFGGMLMASASRDLGAADRITFRTMLSPEPLMGKRGYPLLLASGETADGKAPLIDRQHPHDLFMELSASWSHQLDAKSSVFLYGGLPGEPAFGPPAFMHRLSILDSPEAPISHHWLDSTHITMGVLTAGYIRGDWKLEASTFRGREPDQHRYDIERPKFDSAAVRLSWNPSPEWSLQGSWARAKSPEQLEPEAIDKKWSASAMHFRDLGEGRWWSSTLAFGRRSADHGWLDALVLESAIKPERNWTIFARTEQTKTNELAGHDGHHGATYTVAKASIGAIRDFPLAGPFKIGVGALVSANRIPTALQPAYGGQPLGGMAFVRLRLG